MSAFGLKLCAVLFMTIDHAGAFLFPKAIWLRCIGRMAFPIFAWSAAQGCRHTRSMPRYMGRLALAAVISEPCFDLPHGSLFDPSHQSILLTLLLAVLAVRLLERFPGFGWLLSLLCCMAAELLRADYGWYGVALVLVFYAAPSLSKAAMDYALLSLLYSLPFLAVFRPHFVQFALWCHQFWGLLAFLLLACYNGNRGPKSGWFFYVFYPAHLLLFGLIS